MKKIKDRGRVIKKIKDCGFWKMAQLEPRPKWNGKKLININDCICTIADKDCRIR